MTGFLFGGGAGTTVTATGSTTARSLADRAAEVFNVKDYGAVGNGSADDTTPIRNTLSAMYTAGGGTVYFPRGSYKVTAPIDISTALTVTAGAGRLVGDGVGASSIVGQVDTDFVINMPHQANGVGEISNLSITNTSTFIGTGALRYAQNNGKGFLHNLYLAGMTCLDVGWNIFNTTVIGVTLEKGGNTSSPYGSIGITNGGANISGVRGNFCHEIGITMVGSNAMTVSGISFEITPVAVVLGQYIGFGTATITGANGSKKLTVSGTLYPPAAATAIPLQVGDQIVTSGVDPRDNPTISVTAQDSGTTSEQGVYSLSGADNVTISVAQPITIRRRYSVAGFTLANMETEGCGIGIYCLNATGKISACYITAGINQGATNQYGSLTGQNSSPQCSLFVDVCGGLVVDACAFSARTTKDAVQFRSDGLIKHTTFISCATVPGFSSTSDANAFIDNGAGTTLVTNNSTAAGSKVLNFTAGTIPGSVVAGVPVYDVTTSSGIAQYNYVASVNNGAGTVTLQNVVGGGVGNGDTIRFCVPSGVAGNVLTVQVIDNTLGRGTTVPAPGLVAATQGGFAVAGAGISTGANTPMISDQVSGGYGQGTGGGGHAQYTLVKADGSAVSLNVGPEVMTFAAGKTWGVDNLTDLSGMDATSKASVKFVNCDQTDPAMNYADLPGQSGVHVDEGAKVGDEYDIANSNTATWGATAAGGGSNKVKVRYNGTNWTVVGK
jgi:hypothetical protein